MRLPALVPALLIAFLAAGARAEEPSTVAASGSAQLSRDPELMRPDVEIRAEGKTLKEAIENLKTRRESIKAALVKLGAVEKSIDISPARSGENPEAILRAQMMSRSRGRRGPVATQAASVSVSASVRADWTLPAGDSDARLLAVSEFQEKIKASKVFEAKPAAEKTEEEEELEGMLERGGPKPGDPSFSFVARFTDAEVEKAVGEAYAKAIQDARRTIKAAGLVFGVPKSIGTRLSGSAASTASDWEMSSYGPYRSRPAGNRPADPAETASPTLGPVVQEVTVHVSCSFTLR